MTDRDRCRLHTTGRLAQQAHACPAYYNKLQDHLGGESYGLDTPVGLDLICEALGLDNALWALRCVLPEQEAERDRIARLFACECVERVLPIFERLYPTDIRPRHAIATAGRFVRGEVTTEELAAARAAARAAADAAAGDAAWAATRAAARAASSDAASAAWAAASDAARAAGYAAGYAAWDAAGAVVNDAGTAEREAQREIFLRLLSTDKESVSVTT
jgi:hypothetical protein